MRMLFSAPWFFPEAGGGGQTYVAQVAKGLTARSHSVQVLAGKKWRGGEGRWKLSRYRHDGIEMLVLAVNPESVRWQAIAENSPSLREGLSEALDETRPDMVHLNGFKPALTALCLEKVSTNWFSGTTN